jgi:hypothetical protein
MKNTLLKALTIENHIDFVGNDPFHVGAIYFASS